MESNFESSAIPAHVFVQLLQSTGGSIPNFVDIGAQVGHGFFGNLFGAVARGVKSALIPALSNIGKSVICDVVGGHDFATSAIHRTGTAVIKGLTGIARQTGSGRKRRAKKAKPVVVGITKPKRKRKSVAKKAVSKKKPRKSSKKKASRKKKTNKKARGVPLAKLIQHSSRSNPFAA
ncbi:hypothetical protein RvY_02350 [Ramazzottius varieornatus]|uniref:Uncharacterized protein n=1 Tax=Ramazzottius varieornatus TaxID=947166 RepID=A0A1D1UUJ3_RAMVA|nr:hypothetical protein RvY_02350 [Ramazzottius varieornatus]